MARSLGVGEVDPAEVLRRTIAMHEWAMEQLEAIAAGADNSNAALAAVRGRLRTAQELWGLLGDAGLVFRSPVEWSFERQAAAAFAALTEVAERHGIDPTEIVAEWRARPGAPLVLGRTAA